MNFDLNEDQRKLQATVADFAQSEVAPVAEALDRDGVFPTELFKKAGELGITAIPFSEDLGGMGLGVLDMVIALEQLARADQSLAVSVMVSVASGLTLGRFGDAELARKYLPDIIAGLKICGIAGTEPNAGSDTSGFKTRAVQRGNGWRLNGEKAFITNGGTDIIDLHDPGRHVAAGSAKKSLRFSSFPAARKDTRRANAIAKSGGIRPIRVRLLSARLRYRSGPHYRPAQGGRYPAAPQGSSRPGCFLPLVRSAWRMPSDHSLTFARSARRSARRSAACSSSRK